MPGGSRLFNGNGRRHGPTKRIVELPESFPFQLSHALGAETELHSDFLQWARITVEAEVRRDDSALAVGQLAQRLREHRLLLGLEHVMRRNRDWNVGERSRQRQPLDPERLIE